MPKSPSSAATRTASIRATCPRSVPWPGRPSWRRAVTPCVGYLSPTRGWVTSSTSSAPPVPRPVVVVALRPPFRDARRREGDGPADTTPPGDASAGGRVGGRHTRWRTRRHFGLGPGATLVILTGRAGLIALICALPIALSARPATSFLVLLMVLAAGVIADIGWAASPSRLQYTRMHNGSVRLGEAVNTGLLIHNAGRRRFRG